MQRVIRTEHLEYRGDAADPGGGYVFRRYGYKSVIGHIQNMPSHVPADLVPEWGMIFDLCMAEFRGWNKLARAIERERRKKRRKP